MVDERNRVMQPTTPCRPNAKIFYYRELEVEAHIPFKETILYVDEHLLHDGESAAGILPMIAWRRLDADGRGVRGLFAVEHLHERGHCFGFCVSGKAVHGDAPGVGEQFA